MNMRTSDADTGTIRVFAFPVPFAAAVRKDVTIPAVPGETAAAAVRRAFPEHAAAVNAYAVRLRFAAADDPVTPGDVVVGWALPKEAVTGTAAWAAVVYVAKIIAVVGFVASIGFSVYSYMQSRRLMKSLRNSAYGKEVDDASDTNFGWDFDARNSASEGSPAPVLYGRRYVIPPVIQQRVTVSPISGAEFLEVITAVAQGGAGFADRVAFPNNEQGNVDILLNHANWANYISKEQYGNDSSEEINRLNSGVSVYNGVYWDGTTLISNAAAQNMQNLVDGDTSTRPTGLSSSQQYGYMNLPDPPAQRKTKHTRNFYFALPDVCKVSRVRLFTNKKNLTFSVYAGDGSDVTKFTRIGNSANNATANSWKNCLCDTGGKFYRNILISNFNGGGDGKFFQIEVYGSINAAVEENITGYAEVETRPGDYNQAPVSICSGVWAALNVGKGLNLSWFNFETSVGASPETLSVTFEFPYGLYDSSGATMEAKTVKIACQRRGIAKDGTPGEWEKFSAEFDSNSVVEITDTSTTPKKVQFSTRGTLGDHDRHEVRARLAEDPGLSANVVGSCNWELIEEGFAHKPQYPKMALAAVRMLSTESLSGGAPQIKVMAERPYVMVYNAIEERWQAKSASNPAWVAYDLIVRPRFDDRAAQELDAGDDDIPLFDEDSGNFAIDLAPYLRGVAFPVERMRYTDFADWAEYCDAGGITCSMYFDGTSTVTECLQYICEIGRAGLVNRANVLGVVIDRQAAVMGARNQPLPLFRFDDTNIVADSWSEEWRNRKDFPSEVQVTYFDRMREYTRKGALARQDERLTHNPKDLTLYACDDVGVAKRHAEYVLGMNKILRSYAWTGDLDAMPLDLGDLVEVKGKLATITGVSFDDELRREFKALEYAHDRFGWRKMTLGADFAGRAVDDAGATSGRINIVCGLPATVADVTLAEYFAECGLDDAVMIPWVNKEGAVYTFDGWPLSLRNVRAIFPMVLFSDSVDFAANLYFKATDAPALAFLGTTGWRLVSLSFDVPDFTAAYSNLNGVNYTKKVTFHKLVKHKNGAYVEEDIPLAASGGQRLFAGAVYKVYCNEVFDLPMFPPPEGA